MLLRLDCVTYALAYIVYFQGLQSDPLNGCCFAFGTARSLQRRKAFQKEEAFVIDRCRSS